MSDLSCVQRSRQPFFGLGLLCKKIWIWDEASDNVYDCVYIYILLLLCLLLLHFFCFRIIVIITISF